MHRNSDVLNLLDACQLIANGDPSVLRNLVVEGWLHAGGHPAPPTAGAKDHHPDPGGATLAMAVPDHDRLVLRFMVSNT